jgi:hypothetical protein
MPTREELMTEYDDACVELDRANVEAFMIPRRARLAGVPVDPDEVEAVQRRIRVAERQVRATANEMKAAGWAPARPNGNAAYARHRETWLQAQQGAA